MKRKNLLVASLSFAMMGAVIVSAGVFNRRKDVTQRAGEGAKPEPTASTPKLNTGEAEAASYKVARMTRSSNEGNKLYLDISVEPQYFVRDKMISLARRLNHDFSGEPRLVATILDDDDIARNFNPIGHSYNLYRKAERGEYHLDRAKGEEYIQFSTERGRPPNEIRVELGRRPAKKSKGRR